jgi:REP element-mobilizing transposase RayT
MTLIRMSNTATAALTRGIYLKQTSFFKNSNSEYGGELLKTRKGRSSPRPLATRSTMHLVLRSTRARGKWSMKHARNEEKIRQIAAEFCQRYGIRLLSLANVGNHLHFHIQLAHRATYAPFIRGLTGAIAMAVTGRNRWSVNAARTALQSERSGGRAISVEARSGEQISGAAGDASTEFVQASKNISKPVVKPLRFWDCRPFTRIIVSRQAWLNLRDYIQINVLEGFGHSRQEARWIVQSRQRPQYRTG